MKRKTEAFKKENLMILFILLGVFVITVIIYLIQPVSTKISEITVTKIINGDTFQLSSGERIKLLCINSPKENEAGFQESKQYLSDLILNKQVRLEKGSSDKDKDGNLLRYVYIADSKSNCQPEEKVDPNTLSDQICLTVGDPTNEIFVNGEMIRANKAIISPQEPNTKLCGSLD